MTMQRLDSYKVKSFTFVKQLLYQKIPVPPHGRPTRILSWFIADTACKPKSLFPKSLLMTPYMPASNFSTLRPKGMIHDLVTIFIRHYKLNSKGFVLGTVSITL